MKGPDGIPGYNGAKGMQGDRGYGRKGKLSLVAQHSKPFYLLAIADILNAYFHILQVSQDMMVDQVYLELRV